jgi:hypothetical protein
MPEKRESLEGVYGVVPRGPRDRSKAIRPESKSPAVEPHTHCYSATLNNHIAYRVCLFVIFVVAANPGLWIGPLARLVAPFWRQVKII